MDNAEIVIIGGGIWGLSTAYHLSRDSDAKVVLLERNAELAFETTKQSAGQVGQLRGDALLARGIGYTLELLRNFAEVTGHDPKYVESGSLHLSLVPQRTAMIQEVVKVAEEVGVKSDFVSKQEMAELAPNFKFDSVDAGLYVPNDGYVDGRSCAIAYGNAAIDNGVDVRLNSTVKQLVENGSTITLKTDSTEVEAKHVVVCGGPWTSKLVRSLGVYPPMYPIRLQQARSVACDVVTSHPVVRVPDESCYIRPEKGGFLYGFFDPTPHPICLQEQSDGFSTQDIHPEKKLVEESQRRLAKVLPDLLELGVEEFRQGMMTCTPDGKFVIGQANPSSSHDNRSEGAKLWIATGCGGTGIAGSGAVGSWLSEWILTGKTKDDLRQYSPHRFGDQSQDLRWLGEQACETSAAYYRLK